MNNEHQHRPWKSTETNTSHDPKTEQVQRLDPEAREFVEHFDRYVILEDKEILVLNKPPWIPMDTSEHHTIGLQQLVWMARDDDPQYVHRLDKNTSGAVIFAKTPEARASLQEQFRLRKTKKSYLALVDGDWNAHVKGIIAPLSSPVENGGRIHVDTTSTSRKDATTSFSPIARFHDRLMNPKTLLAIRIWTGRTHQIRAHLSHLQFPITGDHVYNPNRRSGYARQLLHSYRLMFFHPKTGDEITVHASLASDFKKRLQGLVVDEKIDIYDELFEDPPAPTITPKSEEKES